MTPPPRATPPGPRTWTFATSVLQGTHEETEAAIAEVVAVHLPSEDARASGGAERLIRALRESIFVAIVEAQEQGTALPSGNDFRRIATAAAHNWRTSPAPAEYSPFVSALLLVAQQRVSGLSSVELGQRRLALQALAADTTAAGRALLLEAAEGGLQRKHSDPRTVYLPARVQLRVNDEAIDAGGQSEPRSRLFRFSRSLTAHKTEGSPAIDEAEVQDSLVNLLFSEAQRQRVTLSDISITPAGEAPDTAWRFTLECMVEVQARYIQKGINTSTQVLRQAAAPLARQWQNADKKSALRFDFPALSISKTVSIRPLPGATASTNSASASPREIEIDVVFGSLGGNLRPLQDLFGDLSGVESVRISPLDVAAPRHTQAPRGQSTLAFLDLAQELARRHHQDLTITGASVAGHSAPPAAHAPTRPGPRQPGAETTRGRPRHR